MTTITKDIAPVFPESNHIGEAKGRISTTLSVHCGKCTFWEYLESVRKGRATKEARRKNWFLTNKWGWVCPSCMKRKPADSEINLLGLTTDDLYGVSELDRMFAEADAVRRNTSDE